VKRNVSVADAGIRAARRRRQAHASTPPTPAITNATSSRDASRLSFGASVRVSKVERPNAAAMTTM
jgi:hypothetical protein